MLGAAGALLVLVAAAIIIPLYGDYEARVRASEVLDDLRPLKARIASRAVAVGKLTGAGVGENTAKSGADYAAAAIEVLPDGVIIVKATKFGQVFVLLPSLSENHVSWRCIGGSDKDVPRACGG